MKLKVIYFIIRYEKAIPKVSSKCGSLYSLSRCERVKNSSIPVKSDFSNFSLCHIIRVDCKRAVIHCRTGYSRLSHFKDEWTFIQWSLSFLHRVTYCALFFWALVLHQSCLLLASCCYPDNATEWKVWKVTWFEWKLTLYQKKVRLSILDWLTFKWNWVVVHSFTSYEQIS